MAVADLKKRMGLVMGLRALLMLLGGLYAVIFPAQALFVLIWSTGFIAAKFAVPHGDLQLFLLVRLSITAVVMALLALSAGVRTWPVGQQLSYQLLAGVLVQLVGAVRRPRRTRIAVGRQRARAQR